jgi:hypothetical protein
MAGDDLAAEAEEAKEQLRLFLDDLRDLLYGCLIERPELLEVEARFGESWSATEARFAHVRSVLEGRSGVDEKELTPQRLKKVEDELAAHGLTGAELELKLALFRGLLNDFLDELAAQDDAERYWAAWIVRFRGSSWWERVVASRLVQRIESLRREGRSVVRGRLKLGLDAGALVLGSLGQALSFLPGVGAAVGGIRELKEALDVSLSEPDSAEKPPRRPPPGSTDVQQGLRALDSRVFPAA